MNCPAFIEYGIDACGHRHAAHGGKHRQHRLARVGELAHGHLVFKFDTNQQEENRHEEIVYEDLNGKPHR